MAFTLDEFKNFNDGEPFVEEEPYTWTAIKDTVIPFKSSPYKGQTLEHIIKSCGKAGLNHLKKLSKWNVEFIEDDLRERILLALKFRVTYVKWITGEQKKQKKAAAELTKAKEEAAAILGTSLSDENLDPELAALTAQWRKKKQESALAAIAAREDSEKKIGEMAIWEKDNVPVSGIKGKAIMMQTMETQEEEVDDSRPPPKKKAKGSKRKATHSS
jgi:hypothetical protein